MRASKCHPNWLHPCRRTSSSCLCHSAHCVLFPRSRQIQSALRLNATHADTLACLADVLLEWSSLPLPASEAQQRCSGAPRVACVKLIRAMTSIVLGVFHVPSMTHLPPTEALATYERALAAGGDAEVAYNAACACSRLGQGDRCAQLLQVRVHRMTRLLQRFDIA
jgi:hypothetical protein